jgi:hypothetical protein
MREEINKALGEYDTAIYFIHWERRMRMRMRMLS